MKFIVGCWLGFIEQASEPRRHVLSKMPRAPEPSNDRKGSVFLLSQVQRPSGGNVALAANRVE